MMRAANVYHEMILLAAIENL